METSEVLNKAADLIEERGWKSGGGWQYADQIYHDMPLCLEGGIQAATGHRFASAGGHILPEETAALRGCPAYVAVAEHLNVMWPLYDWNDARERTAAEVIEVLRACALIESAREEQDAAWETYAESASA